MVNPLLFLLLMRRLVLYGVDTMLYGVAALYENYRKNFIRNNRVKKI